jgi:transposase
MGKTVYIGGKEKIKVRLIIYLLLARLVEQRIRNLKKERSKKGRDINFSQKYKARLALNLLLTNTDREQVSTKSAWSLYRLRWQIELIFKTWKSFAAIDKVKKVQRYRLQCYIYARLILILIGWKIIWR